MQSVVLRGAGDHAFENVRQIDLGIDAMQLGRVEKRRENRLSLTAAFVSAEQTVLFADGYLRVILPISERK
jgi:hypothetical protein